MSLKVIQKCDAGQHTLCQEKCDCPMATHDENETVRRILGLGDDRYK